MHWTIIYYNNKVFDEIESLPKGIKAKYVFLTDVMVERGPNLGLPHTRAMGDGLFEIRIKGQEGIARVFYCTERNKQIIMLHSFIKKTPRTPIKELNLAQFRMKEVQKNDESKS